MGVGVLRQHALLPRSEEPTVTSGAVLLLRFRRSTWTGRVARSPSHCQALCFCRVGSDPPIFGWRAGRERAGVSRKTISQVVPVADFENVPWIEAGSARHVAGRRDLP